MSKELIIFDTNDELDSMTINKVEDGNLELVGEHDGLVVNMQTIKKDDLSSIIDSMDLSQEFEKEVRTIHNEKDLIIVNNEFTEPGTVDFMLGVGDDDHFHMDISVTANSDSLNEIKNFLKED